MSNRLEDVSYRSGVIVALIKTLMDDVETSPTITNKQAVMELLQQMCCKSSAAFIC